MATQGKAGQVVITIDVESGDLVSVRDEEGKAFERFTPSEDNPLIFREVYKGVNVGTMFYARTNPCYITYWKEGVGWLKKQVPCP